MSVNTVKSDGSLQRVAGGSLYADAPIGAIQAYGGTTAPAGWLICDGQAISRTTYSALFEIIGTAFGAGDDSTTFNIPDLRECVLVGAGQNTTNTIAAHDTYTVGQFKDDQFQAFAIARGDDGKGAPSGYSTGSNGNQTGNSGYQNYTTTPIPATAGGATPRTGTTTHGKQKGVNYIIKAKQAAVPHDVAEYVRTATTPDWSQGVTTQLSTQSGSTSTGTLTQTVTVDEDCYLIARHYISDGGSVSDCTMVAVYYGNSTTGQAIADERFVGYSSSVATSPIKLLKGETITITWRGYNSRGFSKNYTIYPVREV